MAKEGQPVKTSVVENLERVPYGTSKIFLESFFGQNLNDYSFIIHFLHHLLKYRDIFTDRSLIFESNLNHKLLASEREKV